MPSTTKHQFVRIGLVRLARHVGVEMAQHMRTLVVGMRVEKRQKTLGHTLL